MMPSRRFDRPVQVTAHARARMIQRGIDDALLRDLIETGEVRYKGERRFWIAKWYPQRRDNLVLLRNKLCPRLEINHLRTRQYTTIMGLAPSTVSP